MHYTIFASLIFLFSLSIFGWNYQVTTTNRIYLGLYKGVAERSVVVVDSHGKDLEKPMFSEMLFHNNLDNYIRNLEGFKTPRYAATVILYDDDMNIVRTGFGTTLLLRLSLKDAITAYTPRTACFTIQEGHART